VDSDMLDRIVEAAEQSGVYLQVVVLTRNHYMDRLRTPGSRAYLEATDYAGRLARYFAARWGYSTHILAWEYFNEIDPGLPMESFYAALAKAFDAVDVNRHLRATSTWHSPSKDYANPHLDTANLHYYLRAPSGEIWKDEVAAVLQQWEICQKPLKQKPLFFAEFGITDERWQRAPELDRDREFVHLHNALWASALSGFASTVCHWYWDDIHRRNLYALYAPIARFMSGMPLASDSLKPVNASAGDGLRVVGLQGSSGAYVWIHDSRATWWKIAVENRGPEPVEGAVISISDLPQGPCRVEWWDTHSGKIFKTEIASGPAMRLAVPPFKRDVALKVLPQKQ